MAHSIHPALAVRSSQMRGFLSGLRGLLTTPPGASLPRKRHDAHFLVWSVVMETDAGVQFFVLFSFFAPHIHSSAGFCSIFVVVFRLFLAGAD